ncbi:hypothetical protein BABINDRAFT_163552 [Babjeviella inositovora NRRL Y-12698]|uniref:Phosphotransferase n=1 Tax=Babjeviella inositovora NRRL Y-12698 TaxID=984486 RepID=A0A1E3QIN0_9ASCO|nr:uncharacterized protein BABINDRAFT_163552 [Babjeviella inositovora NRRL Y-12698]ODQ77556.1 hypothetical protein BABINDRAFT_163552 [Babjeviella inositovora NRRL Y-12698]
MISSTLAQTLSSTPIFTPSVKTTASEKLVRLLTDLHHDFTGFIHQQDSISRFTTSLVGSFKEAVYASPITMIPTFYNKSTGNETGHFVVIDLGGSTLRVAVVLLALTNTQILAERSWEIKDSFKVLSYEFFAWIAERVEEVLDIQTAVDKTGGLIHVGLTWSFPVKQTSKNSGIIQEVSKGYQLTSEVAGKDLKVLIESACLKRKLEVQVEAIINDAVSVFITGEFFDEAKLAIVLGTGTNSCLPLPTRLFCQEKQVANYVQNDKECLVNTELSIFGLDLLSYATQYDKLIDFRFGLSPALIKPHMNLDNGIFQPIEEMTSGRYISELVRLVMVDFIAQGQLFRGACPLNLTTAFEFSGELVCFLSETSDNDKCKAKLSEFLQVESDILPVIEDMDIAVVKSIISVVVERGAFIVACSILALCELSQISGDDKVNVPFVGSILNHFVSYREQVEKFLNQARETLPRKHIPRFCLKHAASSSVIGASVAAAVNMASSRS